MIVKIGCFNYEVELADDHIVVGDKANFLGSIDYENLNIKVKKTLPEEMKNQVLMHEIVHGILNHFELTINNDEKQVDLIAKGIYDFIVQNKEFINTLFQTK